MSDTIAAIATGNCVSAIGIIRISGDEAISALEQLFVPNSKKPLSSYKDRSLILGNLLDATGEVIDSCLATFSHGPHSYTGENTAEIQCHGSPVILRLCLDSLFQKGVRQAFPGEFTKRAFLNGCLDLSSAEAVIDLIEADSEEIVKNAAAQLGGAISEKIDGIYSQIVDIISHYHAVIDYPDEDIDEFLIEEYKETFESAKRELEVLLGSFKRGRLMKEGLSVAIVGRPNAGKSSLLNALLGYERAIVTNIAGTTRDTIEEGISLGGVKLRLIDTAGIRDTIDPIEQIGVDKSKKAAENSSLALVVFDGSEKLQEEDFNAMEASRSAEYSIAIINKSDLKQEIDLDFIKENYKNICIVSALDKSGLEALEKEIAKIFPKGSYKQGEILTNERQAQSVALALESINSSIEALSFGATPDIILTEAENALVALGELSGKTVREDVTHRIFDRFCVGK